MRIHMTWHKSTKLKLDDANSVGSHAVSWNKVALLHGPPGTGKTSLCKALAQKLSVRLSQRYLCSCAQSACTSLTCVRYKHHCATSDNVKPMYLPCEKVNRSNFLSGILGSSVCKHASKLHTITVQSTTDIPQTHFPCDFSLRAQEQY